MTITATDLFCGAGGSSLGATTAGVQLVMAANHWQTAIDVHQEHFPDAGHDCADVSQADPRRYPRTDILLASPECFPAGTLVTTQIGQVPIDRVEVGQMVLTHRGRWQPVTRIQSRLGDTVVAKGQGHWGLEVTANHRFPLRSQQQTWNREVGQMVRTLTPVTDVRIGDAIVKGDGRHRTKKDQVKLAGNAVTPPVMAWIVGRVVQALEATA